MEDLVALLYAREEAFNRQLGAVVPGEEPLMVEQMSMEELFGGAEPDLGEEEARKLKALIRWIFAV